eukprot:TRINITY_DN8592_c0_g1_i1.p1 TRINITY_DN8592_c0_g1~~TRINITY_DN8592_c0_g1_i1.p1  ORF type:complete len:999 (+),score=189.42 TRINITY_DN8592_c0_g1_i1:42-2999(+)
MRLRIKTLIGAFFALSFQIQMIFGESFLIRFDEQHDLTKEDKVNIRIAESLGIDRIDVSYPKGLNCRLKQEIKSVPSTVCRNVSTTTNCKPIHKLRVVNVTEDCSRKAEYCTQTFRALPSTKQTIICSRSTEQECSGECNDCGQKCFNNPIVSCTTLPQTVAVTEKRQYCQGYEGLVTTKICITYPDASWVCREPLGYAQCDSESVKQIAHEESRPKVECLQSSGQPICMPGNCHLKYNDTDCLTTDVPEEHQVLDEVCEQCVHGRTKLRTVVVQDFQCLNGIREVCQEVSSTKVEWKKSCTRTGHTGRDENNPRFGTRPTPRPKELSSEILETLLNGLPTPDIASNPNDRNGIEDGKDNINDANIDNGSPNAADIDELDLEYKYENNNSIEDDDNSRKEESNAGNIILDDQEQATADEDESQGVGSTTEGNQIIFLSTSGMNYNTESRVYFPTATTRGDVALGSTTMSSEYVDENGSIGVDSSTINSNNDGRTVFVSESGSTSSTQPTADNYNYYPENHSDTKPQTEADEQTTIQNGINFFSTDGSESVRIESQDFDVKLPDDDYDFDNQIKPGIIQHRNVTASNGMNPEVTNTAVTPPLSMTDFSTGKASDLPIDMYATEDNSAVNDVDISGENQDSVKDNKQVTSTEKSGNGDLTPTDFSVTRSSLTTPSATSTAPSVITDSFNNKNQDDNIKFTDEGSEASQQNKSIALPILPNADNDIDGGQNQDKNPDISDYLYDYISSGEIEGTSTSSDLEGTNTNSNEMSTTLNWLFNKNASTPNNNKQQNSESASPGINSYTVPNYIMNSDTTTSPPNMDWLFGRASTTTTASKVTVNVNEKGSERVDDNEIKNEDDNESSTKKTKKVMAEKGAMTIINLLSPTTESSRSSPEEFENYIDESNAINDGEEDGANDYDNLDYSSLVAKITTERFLSGEDLVDSTEGEQGQEKYAASLDEDCDKIMHKERRIYCKVYQCYNGLLHSCF